MKTCAKAVLPLRFLIIAVLLSFLETTLAAWINFKPVPPQEHRPLSRLPDPSLNPEGVDHHWSLS